MRPKHQALVRVGTPPSTWTLVRSGAWRGKALQARFDTSWRGDEAVVELLPQWASVTAFLQSPRDDGMPGPEEAARLAELDQSLFASLVDDAGALLVGAVTTDRRHDMMLYAASAETARELFRKLQERELGWELQLTIMEDASWEVYRQFVP